MCNGASHHKHAHTFLGCRYSSAYEKNEDSSAESMRHGSKRSYSSVSRTSFAAATVTERPRRLMNENTVPSCVFSKVVIVLCRCGGGVVVVVCPFHFAPPVFVPSFLSVPFPRRCLSDSPRRAWTSPRFGSESMTSLSKRCFWWHPTAAAQAGSQECIADKGLNCTCARVCACACACALDTCMHACRHVCMCPHMHAMPCPRNNSFVVGNRWCWCSFGDTRPQFLLPYWPDGSGALALIFPKLDLGQPT